MVTEIHIYNLIYAKKLSCDAIPHHTSWVLHCTLVRDPVLGCAPVHPEHFGTFDTLHEPFGFSVTVIVTVSVP